MKTKKRFLSILLSLVLVLGMLPGMSLTAYAAVTPTYRINVIDVKYNDTKTLAADTALPYNTSGQAVYNLQGYGGYSATILDIISGNNVNVSGTSITVNGVGTTRINIRPNANAENMYFDFIVTRNITANATGFSGPYDNAEHGISVGVSVPSSGYTIKYGTTNGTYDKTESPKFTAGGNHTVYYQVTADGYNTKTGSAVVSISKADPTAPSGLTATYGQTLANVTLPDGWTWADSTQSVGNVVDPAATFKANFAGDDNHNAASNVDVTVTVGKADPTAPTGLTATYGQTLANVTLPDGWTWADSTQSVGNVVDPAATFKANFAGDDNHNAASNVDVTVTVGKANAIAATVTANSRTYDGTEKPLVTVTGEATGGTMRYALGTATEATQPYTTSIPTKTDAGT